MLKVLRKGASIDFDVRAHVLYSSSDLPALFSAYALMSSSCEARCVALRCGAARGGAGRRGAGRRGAVQAGCGWGRGPGRGGGGRVRGRCGLQEAGYERACFSRGTGLCSLYSIAYLARVRVRKEYLLLSFAASLILYYFFI